MSAMIPAHVPADRVFDFDFMNSADLKLEPHKRIRRLLDEAPEIFYTPQNGGHWIVTRAALALEVFQRHEDFSVDPRYNWGQAREPRTIPNLIDPPDHADYRRILNPWFSPKAVLKYEDEVRALSRELIGGVLASGECEFVEAIGRELPIVIFLRIVDAPLADRDRLLEIAESVVRGKDMAERKSGWAMMGAYLRPFIASRREKPGDDLVSYILASRFRGRPLTDDEVLGMTTLIFLGGLDTVASLLPFIMGYLATHPDDYARLVADPQSIPLAIEELLRVHGIVATERGVTHDLEFHGVAMRQMDRVILLTQMYGFDDREIPDPGRVDFNRPASQHFLFGGGAHRCLGSHLARLELRVFLDEWVRVIDRFGVRGGDPVPTLGGHVWSPQRVNLEWETSAKV
jgi:cytochrome P450